MDSVVILSVESSSDQQAFIHLSRDYLIWHLSDIGKYLGRTIDMEPYLAAEDKWLSDLLIQGRAWVAADDVGPCGIVALDLRRGFAEIKRLFIADRVRYKGLGRKLAEHVISFAACNGHKYIRLDTFQGMIDAIRLYQKLGFQLCEPYFESELPQELFAAWRFMELDTTRI